MAEELKFYRASHPAYGFLSNLYPVDIYYNDTIWDSTESAYQFYKFKDAKIGAWVILAPKQSVLAMTGHLFNMYKQQYVRNDWDEFKVRLMNKLLIIKFKQHPILAQRLLDTGDRILIEDAPNDYFWGCGKDGTGLNMLGKQLMDVRKELQYIRDGERI